MNDLSLKGKVALVTGGTRGIGRAIVKEFLRQGATVIYTGTKAPKSQLKGAAFFWPLDLSQEASAEEFLQRMRELKRLDILVNNAGINMVEPIDALSLDKWDAIIKVNLTGAMRLMKEAAIIMKKYRKGGRILNVSSVFGMISRSKRNAYSASKAGLIGLTRASALDLAPYGVLVNAICPGFVLTDLTRRVLSEDERGKLCKEIPMLRFGTEEEMAKAALFLCSPLNTYITGQTLVVDGGVTIQ